METSTQMLLIANGLMSEYRKNYIACQTNYTKRYWNQILFFTDLLLKKTKGLDHLSTFLLLCFQQQLYICPSYIDLAKVIVVNNIVEYNYHWDTALKTLISTLFVT
jgi:hypothetical protein